jgi:hypothetical protein
MTVPVQTPTTLFLGNGFTTVFPASFRADDASWVVVTLDDVVQTTGYTVSNLGDNNGVTVTFTTAPAIGVVVILQRNTPLSQQTDYQPYSAFPAESHEDALDKLTMEMQDLEAALGRTISTPPSDGSSVDLELPPASVRANNLLIFDSVGNAAVIDPDDVGIQDHGNLLGLSDDDHTQYHNDARGDARYLQLTGGTLTGSLLLPSAMPTLPEQAATKAYVDSAPSGIIVTNYVSNATGNAQPTVYQGWNAQATAAAITRATNEVLYYEWPSGSGNVYRYLGQGTGSAWNTDAVEWPSGVSEAPSDGSTYGRLNASWAKVLPLAGGTLTGSLLLPSATPTLANQAVTKAYVDSAPASIIVTNYVSNATGNAQPTIYQGWNAQATALGITRATNEILYYKWPSSSGNVYRYLGQGVGPTWSTNAVEWPSGVSEAPTDGSAYGRLNSSWTKVLPLTGGTLTGSLLLPSAAPTNSNQAVTKAYVDSLPASIIVTNYVSNATGDAQPTVHQGWNAQATALGITKATNEVIFYEWPSGSDNVYRYLGQETGPTWNSTSLDWPSTGEGVPEAPTDGSTYGRLNATWVTVLPLTGGTLTGQLALPGGGSGSQAITVSEANSLDSSLMSTHIGAADPHTQYQLESQKAAANGYAGLDASAQVPTAQLPRGVANGVASLDSAVKVPTTQLPLGTANGAASLNASAQVPAEQLPLGVPSGAASLDGTGKVPASQLPLGVANGAASLNASVQVPPAQLPLGTANGAASLDSTGKVPTTQLPLGVANGAASLDSTVKVPTTQLPLGTANGAASLNASAQVPAEQLPLGTANGAASLDATGKVPASQLPLGVANGAASLNASVQVPAAQLPLGVPNGAASLDATGKVPVAQLPSQSSTILLPLQATTSGTVFDFAIPTGAKRVVANCDRISLTGSNRLLFQMNGETTGYESITAGITSGTSTLYEASTTGFIVWSNAAGDQQSGEVSFSLADAATNLWVSSHSGRIAPTAVSCGGGRKALSAELSVLRLTRTGSDSFDGGAVSATVYF